MNRKERRVPLRDDQVITVLTPNNPKVEGSAAYDLFEEYRRPTMRVGAYLTAVAKLRRRADCGRRALRWDLDRGFIRIDDLGGLLRGEQHSQIETMALASYPELSSAPPLSVGQAEIDEVARTVYRETAEFYAHIRTRISDDALFGFKILYGPPLARAPLLFVGEQPGGGVGGATDDPQSVLDLERKTWPAVTEYAIATWRLAHAIRAVFDAKFPGLLRCCTGTNENFFRAPSRDHYHRNVNGEVRSEIGYFCKPRVQSLVRAIQPDHVVCIGLEMFRRITSSTTVAIRSPITGHPLVETGTFAGRPAVGVPHLTGVPLRRDERAVIYDYLRTLV